MGLNLFKSFRESFRGKIILTSILFMLITCFSLTAFFVRQQSISLNSSLLERGELLARVLAHSAKVGIFSENRDLLQNPVDGIAQQQEIARVSVFNADGMLLYFSSKAQVESKVRPGSPREKIGNELFKKLSASRSSIYISDKSVLQIWSAVFSTPGYSKTESLYFKGAEFRNTSQSVIGFINITISKEMLNRQLYELVFQAALMAIAAIIIGSLLIFLVIKGITSPLNRLADGIKALGTDGVVEIIPVDTQDEIGRLATAFNEVSESLRRGRAENRQLEMQLRQAQKLEALGTLAGGIAHDFNNILTPIFGYTEMSMDDLPENEELHGNLKQVLKAAARARDLVRQILTFSRQGEMQRRPIKIQNVLKEALKLLRASLPATITITERIGEECGPILADPTNIHRIMMNLGTNAYHAMKDRGGELKVILEETFVEKDRRPAFPDLNPGEYLELSVNDTGVGMEEGTRQRIFDPYFTTKPKGEGTGMGLAMVHGIVKGCGGNIAVESEAGKGTRFQIFFPRIESDPASSVEALAAQSAPRGHERILLVDDEAPIAYMLKQMLEQLGYHVTVRTSSMEALEAFAAQSNNFDVIITDQTMPNMTGDVFAAEAMRLRADIPVIICTGFSEKITAETARRKGIRALLMKPVLKQELAHAIREALDGAGNSHPTGMAETAINRAAS